MAEKKGITIEINGDTTKFQGSITSLNKQINFTQREIRSLDRSLKFNPSSTLLLNSKQKDLAKAIELTKGKAEALRKEMASVDPKSDRYKKLQTELGLTETKLKQLESEYRKFGSTQSAWASKFIATGTKIQNAGKAIESAGQKLKGLSAASALGIGASVKLASDFENGMNKVNTIANLSSARLKKLSSDLLKVSSDTGKSATEITEAAYQALSASVPVDQVAKFTKVATNLAKGGFTDSATSVDLLTTALNAYKLKTSEAAILSDKLLKVQDKGKTTVNELGQSMGMVIPTASALNVNFDNLAASYISLTKQGINTANATTQIRAMLNELSTDGKKVDIVLRQKTGKSFSELMASGKSLGDVLQVLSDSVGGNANAFKNLFKNQRAGQGALAILNGGTKKFNQSLNDVQNSTGKTAQNLKKLDSPSKQAERSLNALKNSGIELGQQFLINATPMMKSLSGGVKSFTNAISKASPATKNLITGFVGITAIASPVLIVFGKLTQGVGNFIKDIPKAVGTVKALGTSIQAAGGLSAAATTGLASLSTVALPLVGVVGALGTAFLLAKKYMSDMAQAQGEAYQKTVNLAEQSSKLQNEVNKSSKAYDSNIDKINTNSTVAEKLTDRIEALASKTNKTASEKARLKALVQELNSIMPGLNAQYDAEKDKLNMSTSAIKQKIQAMKEEAIVSATVEQSAKKQIEIAKLEAQSIREVAQLKNNEAQQDSVRAKLKKANANMEYASQTGDTKAYNEALESSKKYSNELTALTDAHKKLKDAHDKTTASISKTNTEINKLDFTSILAQANSAGVKIPQAIKEGLATGKIAIPQSINELKNLIKFDDIYAKAKAQGVKIPKEMSQGMLSGKVSVATARDYLKNSIKFNGLLEKAKQSGISVPKGLAQGVNSGKISVSSAIKQLEAIAKKHNTGAMKQSGSSAGKTVPSGIASGIRSGMNTVTSSVKTVGNKAVSTAKSSMSSSQGSSAGSNFSSGIASGIRSGSGGAFSAVKSLANGLVSTLKSVLKIHSPSRVTKEDGIYFVQGLVGGISASTKEAEKSAKDLGNATVTALNKELEIHSPSKKTKKSGKHVVNGLVKGVKSNSKKAKKAGKSLAKSVANTKTFKKASKTYESATKTFSNKITNTIQSMNSKINDLNKQYTDAVKSRADSLKTGIFDTYSKDSPVFGYTLTRNLQSQVNDLKEYSSVMNSLRSKLGRNSGLYKELEQMDVSSLNSLKAINGMTSSELKNYVSLFNQRDSLANSQAQRDNDLLKSSINSQIAQAKKDAQNQVNALKNEYISKLKSAGIITNKQAKKLGKQLTSGISVGIRKGQTQLFTTINNLGTKMLKKLKKKLKIHSPSRAFRDEVGIMTARGLAEGIEKGAPNVYQTLNKLSDNMLNTSIALAHDVGSSKTSTAIIQSSSNTDTKIDTLITLMTKMLEKDSNVYIDKKSLVGTISDEMNRQLGAKLKLL